MDAVTNVPPPVNEPVRGYAPGSAERARLQARLAELTAEAPIDLPTTIGGERRLGGGTKIAVVQPHRHASVLGAFGTATRDDARDAVAAALRAAPAWRALSFDDRAAIFLRAADLLAGPWRETLLAATMLGQSKTVQQAEIDSPCELVDFWRFNVHYARRILAEQPISGPGVWNRSDHRPPATSTSTTNPPAPSSDSNPSAAPAPPAPTTKPDPSSTCCDGPHPVPSRRPSFPRPTIATPTWPSHGQHLERFA